MTGYYRKFVRAYGSITTPLNRILKKEEFRWTEESREAFEQLKNTLITLSVGNVELRRGLCARIRCFKGGNWGGSDAKRASSFIYQPGLKGQALSLSTYEKEMLSILLAIQKWRQYLLGRRFIIRTDQRSLKFTRPKISVGITTSMTF